MLAYYESPAPFLFLILKTLFIYCFLLRVALDLWTCLDVILITLNLPSQVQSFRNMTLLVLGLEN